ncbi:MAG: hypothetical protein SWX82_31595 [Cyanobacteriota bacterium]|nr:hypothetical protein [Cyanobacteriota bacterium]
MGSVGGSRRMWQWRSDKFATKSEGAIRSLALANAIRPYLWRFQGEFA